MANCSPTTFKRSGSRSQIATMRAPSTSFHACIWLIAKKPQPINAPFNSVISTRLCHLHEGNALLQAALRLVDDDSDDDHQALNDHLPERRDAHHHQSIRKYADDEGADDRPADRAASARHRGAAENGRGNGVQL